MSKVYYVYSLTVEDEADPFYIGKSFVGSYRQGLHFFDASSGKKSAKANKIRKALSEQRNIILATIATTENEDIAYALERFWIAHYGRKDNGTGILCNHTDGGEGATGRVLSDEHKAKIGEAHKGRTYEARPNQKKPVTAFGLDGKVIRSFESGKVAAERLRLTTQKVNAALRGRIKAAKVSKEETYYQFRYGELSDNIEPVTIGRWANKEKTL